MSNGPSDARIPSQETQFYRLQQTERQIADLQVAVRRMEAIVERVNEAYTAETSDDREFGRAVRVGVYLLMASTLISGLIVPIIQHFLVKG